MTIRTNVTAEAQTPEQSQQREVPTTPEPAPPPPPAVGRPAFRQLKRELSDEDLAGAGARKLILEMLLSAEGDRDEYKAYVQKYYDLAVRSAVLQERLKADETNELMLTIGVGVGGAIIGLAPAFWSQQPNGIITLIVGALLVGGAYLGRRRFRAKNGNGKSIT
jgi:hypothetical protein